MEQVWGIFYKDFGAVYYFFFIGKDHLRRGICIRASQKKIT